MGESKMKVAIGVDLTVVEGILEGWPDIPQKAARATMERYGPPNEVLPFWYQNDIAAFDGSVVSERRRTRSPHARPTLSRPRPS